MARWQPGDAVVLRYFKRDRPVGALPTRAVATSGDPALWLAPGTSVMWPAIRGNPAREVPLEQRYGVPWASIGKPWVGDGVLILGRPQRAHSIWLFWNNWRFTGWYVNLEAAWRPSRLGFDTEDHELDLWIEGSGSWRWKDEHDLDVAVQSGLFTAGEAAAFRAEGERVVAEWPFPTGWEDWRPDPAWSVPTVPEDWDEPG